MKKENIKASLITVNYNGFEVTKNCVNSILENSGDALYEIIIVDSASTDRSLELLKEEFNDKKNILFVPKKVNEFLAAAYNDGFKKANGEIIIFMNNDLLFNKGWLKPLLKAIKNPQTGIAGVSLLSAQDKKTIDTIGGKINLLGFGNRIDSGKKCKLKDEVKEAFFIPGSLIAIKKELFKKIGGFDNKYLGNYEDVDLAWRVRLLGLKVVVAKSSIVYHLGSWSVEKYQKKTHSSFLNRKNRLATLIKNGGILYLTAVLPLYLTSQIMLFTKELIINRQFKQALTTPKAMFWNLSNFGYLLDMRKASQKLRKVSDIKIIRKMSLI